MARDDNGAGTVILAFVLGAVTGAAVALLMAPASGEDVRKLIGEKAREGAEKGREVWNRQRDTISSAIERGREAYQQARGPQAPGTGSPAGDGV